MIPSARRADQPSEARTARSQISPEILPPRSAIGILGPTGYSRFSTRRSTHGARHGEVVQFAKRLRIYSAAGRRPGRVRPYFGGRTGGPELAQRRTAGRV